MSNKKLRALHDAFVKANFKDIRIATDFFKSHLPENLQKRVDFTTLRPTDKEFILPHLKKLQV